MDHKEKIGRFADKIEHDQRKSYQGFSPEQWDKVHNSSWQVHVRPGRKYTKVDVGGSGKFMVDAGGNIFGIKGYGVIHRGHHYGTLDTIEEYWWGEYAPVKLQ